MYDTKITASGLKYIVSYSKFMEFFNFEITVSCIR